MLSGKRILVGVTGSIAAYKSALLVRLLVKAGAEVRVILTSAASEFITPLTLATVSKNPVLSSFVKDDTGVWNNHVDLGLWADAFVIAPASANTLAKMANGICDNLLLATYLSARCPIFFAPAMDLDMYKHPATRANLSKLISWGHTLIDAELGELASGLAGQGRMAEPETIVKVLTAHFQQGLPFSGMTALVTAGPTHEAIDPVRFIGNNSTGKMGFAIAEELARRGAMVHLISGPTHLDSNVAGVQLHRVTSAQEMHALALKYFPSTSIAVLSAAVADFRPKERAEQKIKKTDAGLTVELIKNPDIAADLGKQKKEGQLLVGFALETENEQANAEKKIAAKNFDLIVLNSLNDSGAGFGHDTNQVTLIDKSLKTRKFSLKSKKEVARDIVDTIREYVKHE